jgi:ABC-type branched-subunit amino acid transport system substrate-binding protein
MQIVRVALAVGALAALTVAPGTAQTPSPAATSSPEARNALARDHADTMFSTGHADAAWFTAALLQQTSLAEIDAALARIGKQLGAYTSLEGTNGDYIGHFDRGTDEVLVHVNEDEKIDYLFFRSPLPAGP